jgi:hypothetical protein
MSDEVADADRGSRNVEISDVDFDSDSDSDRDSDREGALPVLHDNTPIVLTCRTE